MEDLENENYINSLLNGTKYYKEYKLLKEMGFNNELMIKKIYANRNPKSIDDIIQFMSKNKDIYQHEFFPNNDNKCFYCGEESKYHINYINKKKEILEGQILERYLGDNINITKEMFKNLTEKGKKATCKIISKNKNGDIIFGSGIFCKIQYFNKKIKVLLTNNHILNEDSIKIGNKIELVYKECNKIIEINDKRFCKTSLTYDFTCIEILNEDKIEDFYEIEKINKEYNYKKRPIAIVQYRGRGKMEIKTGHLVEINDYNIRYKVSTENGSYGSPILLLSNYKIIGIHKSYEKEKDLNIGIYIENIIKYINKNEIIFEYIYLNEEKIKFEWNHKFEKEGKYNFKIISKQLLDDMSYMFNQCSSLTSLNISNFNTNNVQNMFFMFGECSALNFLNLSNFNTNNANNMKNMFSGCSSLANLDLSNFNTNNVTDMRNMFYDCSSLTSLNLSNFNTNNVEDMKCMFNKCSSLTSLNLSNFNTINVKI